MSGKITAEGFRIEGRTGLEVHLDNGETKQLSEFTNSAPLYKTYVALISQTGTNAPTAIVLENTFGGTVVWSRVGNGVYSATLTGVFTDSKTAVFCTKDITSPTGTGGVMIRGGWGSTSTVNVTVVTSNGGADGQIANSAIEIRVYN